MLPFVLKIEAFHFLMPELADQVNSQLLNCQFKYIQTIFFSHTAKLFNMPTYPVPNYPFLPFLPIHVPIYLLFLFVPACLPNYLPIILSSVMSMQILSGVCLQNYHYQTGNMPIFLCKCFRHIQQGIFGRTSRTSSRGSGTFPNALEPWMRLPCILPYGLTKSESRRNRLVKKYIVTLL